MKLDDATVTFLLRLLGLGLVALGPLHAVLGKVFDWRADARKLTPLNARVVLAHLLVVVFVLMALGSLMLVHPELLVEPSPLARLLLWGVTVFFSVRMLAQPFFFDPVLAVGLPWRTAARAVAWSGWIGIVAILVLTLMHQYD